MRRKVMQCLCTATASDAWLWAFVTRTAPKKVVVPVGMVLQEGLLPGRLAAWIAAAQEQHMPLPIIEPIANRLKTGRHFTAIQRSLTTDDEWLTHPTVSKHRLSEEFRDAIYSVRSLGDDECSVACLFRRSGSPQYVAADRRVMHLVLSRAERLHNAGSTIHRNTNWASPPLSRLFMPCCSRASAEPRLPRHCMSLRSRRETIFGPFSVSTG